MNQHKSQLEILDTFTGCIVTCEVEMFDETIRALKSNIFDEYEYRMQILQLLENDFIRNRAFCKTIKVFL